MDLSKDIYVYYSGGSGGVLVQMSLLLLLKETHKNYESNINDVVNNVWNITDVNKWKDTEPFEAFFAGDNTFEEIKAITGNHKNVFRVCGAPQTIHNTNSISISIYTDIETQFTLAKLKKAFWFREDYHREYEYEGVNLYNDIKDELWPDIKSIEDLISLNITIQNELIYEYGFPLMLNDKTDRIGTRIEFLKTKQIQQFNNINVYLPAVTINNQCDYTFLLQDIIDTEFQCVTDALGLDNTEEVKNHINQWVNLHPKNIQKMLKKG